MYLGSIIVQNIVFGTQILIVAVGLYFVYAASRVMHLAIGAIGAASAYGAFFGLTSGWSLAGSILLGISIAVILSIISAYLFEPFAAKNEPLLGLLASFAFGLMIESGVALLFGTDGKNFQSGVLSVVNFFGLDVDLPGVATIYIGIGLAALSWVMIRFTRIGRTLRSVSESSSLSTALGINNQRVRLLVYCLAGLAAGLVVGLTAWHRALTPLIGFHLVIQAFIAFLAGGANDLRGTIVVSYILAIAPGIFIAYIGGLSENWRLVFVFIIAAGILAVRPDGIFSKNSRKV